MKDYVQVPAAELEKPYELTSARESPTFLYLSRSNDFILLVLVVFISTALSYLKQSSFFCDYCYHSLSPCITFSMLPFYRNLSKLKLSNLVSSVFSIVGKFSCIVSGQEVVFVLFRFEPPGEAHCDCSFPSIGSAFLICQPDSFLQSCSWVMVCGELKCLK